MSKIQQMIVAVIGIFVAGFLLVGNSKEQSVEEREAASMVRAVASMSKMAGNKCPVAIKKETGTQVYFPKDTDTDRATYYTMNWVGEKGDNFETASCTLHVSLGGISRLVIDGKVVINKDV